MKALYLPSYAGVPQIALSSLHNHFLERISAGVNHRPIANMEGQRRPLGLRPFLQPMLLPVMWYFVFCGLVGSKDRPKKTQDCTQE